MLDNFVGLAHISLTLSQYSQEMSIVQSWKKNSSFRSYVSVFVRLHQTYTTQNHKNHFFCLLLSYFSNIQLKFSQKGKSIAPNTVKYFQEHRRKGYFKIKTFAFCLRIGSCLKFLSSNLFVCKFNAS